MNAQPRVRDRPSATPQREGPDTRRVAPIVPPRSYVLGKATTAVASLGLLAAIQTAGAQSPPGSPPPRTVTRDGVLSFLLDTALGSVTVRDLLNGDTAAVTPLCPRPLSGALSDDDVTFVVQCAGSPSTMQVNTASYAVVAPPRKASPQRTTVRSDRKNEVIVVGTIHGEHRTSTRYSTTVLRDLLRAMRPDFVLTEIPPNRFEAAESEFRATGTITEPRVARFPEYVDVLFPLLKTSRSTIIPTAGWTRPMDRFRTEALKRIAADSIRRPQWDEYNTATRRADSLVAVYGSDNPYFLNSALYDSIQTEAHEPYNRLFNRELGPGGWDNINITHYAHIARTLDAHQGEGLRFVITYGAGHKEWFLRELRKRSDITILDVAPFLDRIGAARAR